MIMRTQATNGELRDRKAVAWMMLSVIPVSFLGLVIAWAEPSTSPLLYAALDNIFAALLISLAAVKFCPRLFSPQVVRLVMHPPRKAARMNFLMLPCIASGLLTLPLLALASAYLGVMSAIIIFELRSIFLILLNRNLFQNTGRYRPLTVWTWFLLVLGLVGFGFVTIGQSGGGLLGVDISLSALGGSLLGLIAAFSSASLVSFSIKHASMLHRVVKEETGEHIDEVFCTFVSLLAGRIIAGVVLIFASIHLSEDWTIRILSAGFITGAFITAVSNIAFRQANLLTKNLGINALRYTTPLFAVLWLILFADPVFSNVAFLVVGASAIITSNLLINFEAEIRFGYKAFVISLWACGMLVYLYQGPEFEYYYDSIVAVSTMFILLLSFRTDRLVRRTTAEEEGLLALWQQMRALEDSEKIKRARDALVKISAPASFQELRAAYDVLKEKFSDNGDETHAEISGKIDMLVHSKQQGANFGELISLGILAVVVVGGMLFLTPPGIEGWGGFFTEMSACLLAATVLFLFFNIIDLHHDRVRPILEERAERKGKFSIVFRDVQNRRFERWISIAICLGIVLSYAWLFWGKWLG